MLKDLYIIVGPVGPYAKGCHPCMCRPLAGLHASTNNFLPYTEDGHKQTHFAPKELSILDSQKNSQLDGQRFFLVSSFMSAKRKIVLF